MSHGQWYGNSSSPGEVGSFEPFDSWSQQGDLIPSHHTQAGSRMVTLVSWQDTTSFLFLLCLIPFYQSHMLSSEPSHQDHCGQLGSYASNLSINYWPGIKRDPFLFAKHGFYGDFTREHTTKNCTRSTKVGLTYFMCIYAHNNTCKATCHSHDRKR